ncbi:MAG: M12 family metallopeptidase [Cytophagales bacterium]|nr:M12 family metallopeptidase [Cytophagales bacterium]
MIMRKTSFFVTMMLVALFFACEDEASENAMIQTDGSDDPELAYPGEKGQQLTLGTGENAMECEQFGDDVIFEGDIILSKKQHSDLLSGRTSAVGLTGRRWPGGVVYYTVSSSLPNQGRVYNAIAHWEARTGTRFVARTTQPNYVDFVRSSGCSSYLGMIGGRQRINLGDGCSTGNTIHEIGHALGLFHEHTRVDRDETINVNWGNIQSGREHNFRRADERSSAKDYTNTIDFGSIMMYSSYAFSTNGRPTLVRKNGSTWRSQRSGLATSDIQGIQAMYFGNTGGQTLPSGVYTIRARHSGHLVGVENSSTADGANVRQERGQGLNSQRWYVENLGNGVYRLLARHSNKALDVAFSGSEPGTNVHQWGWNGTNAQRWRIKPASNGYYYLESVANNLYLDVAYESTSDGGNIFTSTGHGGSNQQFSFETGP